MEAQVAIHLGHLHVAGSMRKRPPADDYDGSGTTSTERQV